MRHRISSFLDHAGTGCFFIAVLTTPVAWLLNQMDVGLTALGLGWMFFIIPASEVVHGVVFWVKGYDDEGHLGMSPKKGA